MLLTVSYTTNVTIFAFRQKMFLTQFLSWLIEVDPFLALTRLYTYILALTRLYTYIELCYAKSK